jgi:hypothetical protein
MHKLVDRLYKVTAGGPLYTLLARTLSETITYLSDSDTFRVVAATFIGLGILWVVNVDPADAITDLLDILTVEDLT